jgi:uncharacterized protein YjdB
MQELARMAGPGIALALAVAGCTHFATGDDCLVNLAVITPDMATLHVGDTLTLRASITAAGECEPSDATPAQLRWLVSDSLVAHIDSLTGLVTARQPGGTGVTLTTAVTRTVLKTSSITVAP